MWGGREVLHAREVRGQGGSYTVELCGLHDDLLLSHWRHAGGGGRGPRACCRTGAMLGGGYPRSTC